LSFSHAVTVSFVVDPPGSRITATSRHASSLAEGGNPAECSGYSSLSASSRLLLLLPPPTPSVDEAEVGGGRKANSVTLIR
jgi:hypothetical protein